MVVAAMPTISSVWPQNFNAQTGHIIAPQATNNTWYPYPFLTPIDQNEPYLSSALQLIQSLLLRLADVGILPIQHQSSSAFRKAHVWRPNLPPATPKSYGGIVGLSGGLIGPPGTPRDYPGEFSATPVFPGMQRPRSPHSPGTRPRNRRTSSPQWEPMSLARIYPGMGHTINADELAHITAILDRVCHLAHTAKNA